MLTSSCSQRPTGWIQTVLLKPTFGWAQQQFYKAHFNTGVSKSSSEKFTEKQNIRFIQPNFLLGRKITAAFKTLFKKWPKSGKQKRGKVTKWPKSNKNKQK